MNLPNSDFQDFSIEFKEINPEDFPHFEVGEKIIISPNEQGYISESLRDNIDIEERNTLVINAAVGQGKTFSIIEIVKEYYDQGDEYLIIIASPFVSLVEQYYNDVIDKGVHEDKVFRYETLGTEDIGNYTQKRVHIVTANCLLGNPGDDAFINSEVKREYLSTLSNYCKRENKKVVFIYDEIHDAIHNFREKYIFNLWKWKDTIHKNIIISATYNEASKVVIEYLAELTSDKIQIIESKRERVAERESDLFLHYSPARYFKNNNESFAKLVEGIVKRGKEIDILCYSKKLAESIFEDKEVGISKELYKKYDEIRKCTSELISNQRKNKEKAKNVYNKDLCNVGTNFKTGINIVKKNHAYIIILPPRSCKMPFKNLNGIFSNGLNSIIQALARQRKVGEIHVILPRPDEFDYESLPFEEEKREMFINWYHNLKHFEVPEKKVKYYSFQEQNNLLLDFYENTLKDNVKDEIELVKSLARENKVRMLFPEFKTFLLEDGEDYLANQSPFFGGDLSSYVTYAAFTNQFVNCNLKGITFKSTLYFEEGKIQRELERYNEMYFSEDVANGLYSFVNDYFFYTEYRNDIFRSYKVVLKIGGKLHTVKQNGTSKASKLFELQLLGYVQRVNHPNNSFNKSNFYNNRQLLDGVYGRSQYFLDCISHAKYIDLNQVNISEKEVKRILAFKFLDRFRRQVNRAIQTVATRNDSNIKFLPNKPLKGFITASNLVKFKHMMDCFLEDDFFLNLNIFEFKRRFENKTELKRIETFYKLIIEDFFITEEYKLPTGRRVLGKKILNKKRIPQRRNTINFISSSDYDFPKGYLESITLSSEEISALSS